MSNFSPPNTSCSAAGALPGSLCQRLAEVAAAASQVAGSAGSEVVRVTRRHTRTRAHAKDAVTASVHRLPQRCCLPQPYV